MKIDNYSISTNYSKDNNDPKSILEATAAATGAMSKNDQDGLSQIDLSGGFKTYMEQVEEGSLVIHLSVKSPANQSRHLTQENLVRISRFLNERRSLVIGLMSREGLISRNDLTVAASAINAIAEPIQLNPLRPTGLASIESIAHRVLELQEATSILSSDEVISMKRGDTNESVIIPRNIVITENSFKSIFVVRSEIERTTTDLVVKKMDLLGTSKWDFIYKGKKISASIDDLVFITLFHQRATEAIKPHDSVYADLEILNDIGYDSNVVSSKYHVKKIHKILPNPDSGQQTLT